MAGYADVLESMTPRLYGVFSHVYHTKYPFCALYVFCEEQVNMPIPCNENLSLLYYKHTALIGRYTYWVGRILEDFNREVTEPPTCPPSPGEIITTPKEDYDDEYNLIRGPMVSNHKVCPKINWSCAADIYTTATTIMIAVVVSVIVILTTIH